MHFMTIIVSDNSSSADIGARFVPTFIIPFMAIIAIIYQELIGLIAIK